MKDDYEVGNPGMMCECVVHSMRRKLMDACGFIKLPDEDIVEWISGHMYELCRKAARKMLGCPGKENVEEKKQAAADVLDQYSKFVMVCIGNKVRPCDMRLHLMKEISGLPTSLKRDTHHSSSNSEAMGQSSSSCTARLDKAESFRAL